jgi:hypothetical protein
MSFHGFAERNTERINRHAVKLAIPMHGLQQPGCHKAFHIRHLGLQDIVELSEGHTIEMATE